MEKRKLTEWKIGKANFDFSESKQELSEKVNSITDDLLPAGQIAQVHEILIQNGLASAEVLESGDSSELAWVSGYDWFYKTEFTIPKEEEHYFLCCKGLDTVCDIFLNGEYLGLSESMYLPFEKEITDLVTLDGKNSLLLYFHSHEKMLKVFTDTMPERYRGCVPARAMLLKAEDYGADPGKCRGYWNIGTFDDVYVEGCSVLKLQEVTIDVKQSQPFQVYDKAAVSYSVRGTAYRGGMIRADIMVSEADGSNTRRKT